MFPAATITKNEATKPHGSSFGGDPSVEVDEMNMKFKIVAAYWLLLLPCVGWFTGSYIEFNYLAKYPRRRFNYAGWAGLIVGIAVAWYYSCTVPGMMGAMASTCLIAKWSIVYNSACGLVAFVATYFVSAWLVPAGYRWHQRWQ
ncbi:hypothetical protein EJ08DRAFT_697528 [Tothia fuscella]|uniref:Uncharacterized protein n=1 Tax=Tothia fuscella TaxID=1048955 RepID=A0A9P4TYE8_9PEZI|nr:hypothetical protein EJ08DRAFT_697528 [Tothia fuscella]